MTSKSTRSCVAVLRSKFATARTLHLTVTANFVKNGITFGDFVVANSLFAATNFSYA